MDEEGFKAFFTAEYTSVLRTVLLMLGEREAAEDVTQEAFYQVFVHWRKVSRYDKPGAWVRRVAIRMAARARRKVASRGLESGSVPAHEPDIDVQRAVLALPMKQRAAVVLHYYEQRPVTEIATIMRCSDGTVKTHLSRARQRLAVLLEEEVPHVAR